MVVLAIDLQDGFSDDTVVLRIDDKEVFRKELVTSNAMSGFAEHYEQEVEKGRITVDVSIETRRLENSLSIDLIDDAFIGIYVNENRINFRIGEDSFGYL